MTQTSFFCATITQHFFSIVNIELEKISLRFIGNRLSLNVKKTKHTLFQKKSVKKNIPLKPPDLKIANNSIKEHFFDIKNSSFKPGKENFKKNLIN